jgi:GTP cyclohydrolase I
LSDIKEIIKSIISYIGDDPEREGLSSTPDRFLDSLSYLFSGYTFDLAKEIKKISLENRVNDVIAFNDLNFTSCCEHHILPMIGTISLAYIPNNFIIGIGDVLRIVQGYTRRLQLQERITKQIADALFAILECEGVAVSVKATHSCIMCKNDMKMYSNVMLGSFKTDPHKRQEFYNVCNIK